LCDKSPH
jgi:hypothetical protein